MLVDSLKKLSFWSKFIGIFYIVTGVISALIGVVAFVIGAIPGIITVFIGWKLCKAANDANTLSYSNEETELDKYLLSQMVEKYTSFFKILGIYTIVGIVLAIIFILVVIVLGAFVFNNYTNEFSNFSMLIN